MVVNDVGEVIGGQAVALEQDLIFQVGVVHGDLPIDRVLEGGVSLGDFLADDVGFPGGDPGVDLRLGEGQAVPVVLGVGVAFVELGQPLFGAEAAVGAALLNEQLSVFFIVSHPLGLDIGAGRAAHVGAFVIVQAAGVHGALDDLHRVLHFPFLIGVLDAQDKFPSRMAGDQIGVQGGAQIAHVHIAGGGWGEPGAHLSLGDARFHLFKPLVIQSHGKIPPKMCKHIVFFSSGKVKLTRNFASTIISKNL